MKNIEALQKLSLGVNDTQKVKIEYEGKTEEFTLRPLTDGELTRLQTIEKKSMNIKIEMQGGKRQSVTQMNDIDINTGEFTHDQTEAMYEAIALSMSVDGETITADDVRTLPAGLPSIIFKEVINISKLSDGDLTMVKSFRKNE